MNSATVDPKEFSLVARLHGRYLRSLSELARRQSRRYFFIWMTARRCRTTADSSAVTTLRPGLVEDHGEREAVISTNQQSLNICTFHVVF
jgi:hypothetical protein